MDLLNTLKKFKNIQPERGYAEKSRSLVLSVKREARFNVWNIALRNIELGATFALAGVLILLIVGGFSSWEGAAPLYISNLDPAGLKAEATAIDIQIQLMNLDYAGGAVSAKSAESTTPLSPAANEAAPAAPTANTALPNTTTSAPISIDEVLLKLSE